MSENPEFSTFPEESEILKNFEDENSIDETMTIKVEEVWIFVQNMSF